MATAHTLHCHVTPSGQVRLDTVSGQPSVDPAVIGRIDTAFQRGTGHGLLHLGAAELRETLPPALGFWRELGRQFVRAVCASSAFEGGFVAPDADPAQLASLADAVPPMPGAERVNPALLAELWLVMGDALQQRADEHAGGVQGYLEASDPVWHLHGRICLHLAENKADPAFPFAFIATYARQVAGRARPQYVPLSRALQEYAGDRANLLALLTPLQRAAQESALIADLVDSNDIYHPLAWTPDEAFALLCEAEILEGAGLILRLPNWWQTKRRRRPAVSVTVGDAAPSTFGAQALLDFQVNMTLGGETLSTREIETLLQSSAGLILLKGQWVEVDPDKLAQVLAQWQTLKAQAGGDGVSFSQAMRLLAGADVVDATAPSAGDDWSEVVAGKWLHAQLDALRSPETMAAIRDGAGLEAQLRPYQEIGVQWLWTLHSLGLGGCLADDMGLGKTIQVIALLSLLQAQDTASTLPERAPRTSLLIVPASLVDNWKQELNRFAPQLRVFIAHASQTASSQLRSLREASLRPYDVVITTYGTAMRLPWMQRHAWRCLVLDEAQAIKNPGAKQTQAIKRINAQWRLALTGTPVENRLGDLWSIFDFLNAGLLGSSRAFGSLCDAMAQHAGDGYAPLRKLVAPYILRRLKTDKTVIADLPDKTEITTQCLLSKPQAALYQQSVDALAHALAEAKQASPDGQEKMQRRGVVLAFLTRFKQICNHPSQWLGDERFAPAHSGKFQRLGALCEPIAARQEKLLVFTQFRAMTEPLQRYLETCFGKAGLVLHGGTPVKKRAGLVQRFQEDEEIAFMVLSLKAGGTGLNLTAASHVIHFDRWWNPAVENQATDRAFRIGQKKNVLVQKFVCKGTVEERIDQLLNDKQRLSDQVLNMPDGSKSEPKLTELSDDELLALVRLDLRSAVQS